MTFGMRIVSPSEAVAGIRSGEQIFLQGAAATVIAQLNRSMPRTLGDGFLHVSDIDFGVEVDVPPYEHAAIASGDTERRIGALIADLVPDGATLQMGIGAIPAAVALSLAE